LTPASTLSRVPGFSCGDHAGGWTRESTGKVLFLGRPGRQPLRRQRPRRRPGRPGVEQLGQSRESDSARVRPDDRPRPVVMVPAQGIACKAPKAKLFMKGRDFLRGIAARARRRPRRPRRHHRHRASTLLTPQGRPAARSSPRRHAGCTAAPAARDSPRHDERRDPAAAGQEGRRPLLAGRVFPAFGG